MLINVARNENRLFFAEDMKLFRKRRSDPVDLSALDDSPEETLNQRSM